MKEKERGRRKELVGVVTSTAMQKTITVAVERLKFHPIYKKGVKRTKKYKAHDEENKAKVGDVVRIRECRPLSKTKRWRLVEIIKTAEVLRKQISEDEIPNISEVDELLKTESAEEQMEQ